MKSPINYSYNKILLIDLEVSPNLAWVYDKYETTAIDFERYQYVLSISYKWLGRSKIYTYGLPDFPNWKKDRFDDSALLQKLWDVMNEAEVVVAHNIKKFDLKKSNARFLVNHIDPPRPFKVIDTLTVARSQFGFIGNSLNDLCKQLKIGQKTKMTHAEVWKDCINGDARAWKQMKKYNANDVILLEGLYKRFMPWIKLPRLNVDNGKCPKCGGTAFSKNGYKYTGKSIMQRYRCSSCGEQGIYKPLER